MSMHGVAARRVGEKGPGAAVRAAIGRGLALWLGAGLAVATTAGADPGFSAERAFAHLEALSDIGPRVSGTEGAERARAYLREQLEAIGAEVSELQLDLMQGGTELVTLTHLLGELPGSSPDRILLVAHYDTTPVDSFRYVGANASASGPAAVLELGRVLAEGPRPYTVQLLFIDGDALSRGEDGRPRPYGSLGVAGLWSDEGRFVGVRVAFFLGQVADPDLAIARDLRSNRMHRRRVWSVAAELGYTDAFPPDAEFASPDGGHVAFADRGLRSLVAVTDDRYGGDEPPGLFDFTEKDTADQCSAESLGVVGEVLAETLERIEAHLVRIDGFVRRPPAEETEPAPEAGDPVVEDEQEPGDGVGEAPEP
ncbi:MAG: M28 family peptidase [Myxococcota bacterium]